MYLCKAIDDCGLFFNAALRLAKIRHGINNVKLSAVNFKYEKEETECFDDGCHHDE